MSSAYIGRAGSTPPVVKNLIIINVLMYLATVGLNKAFGIDLDRQLGLYYIASPYFRPYQIITHMFMHGSIGHIFFNMFAFWMFGRVLETVWGGRRFFIYYMITGLGAAFLHELVLHFEVANAMRQVSQQFGIEKFTPEILEQLLHSNSPLARKVVIGLYVPTIGASGAVFGVLLAFGVLFPNTQLFLLFPPIPIKAKYFVIGYGLLELYLGITQPGSNIAHFAHIGGMLFGFILLKIWGQSRNKFY
jgi:membrane associated rhomboid family serine protease